MDKAKGRPLEGVVRDIIKGLGRKSRYTEEEIASAWSSSVGRRASSHTRPAALKKSRLVVNVDGSGWLYELTLKKQEILKKLEAKMKGKAPKDIRFRIGEVNKK